MSNLQPDQLGVRFKPRKINLEPKDALGISNLFDGEITEDPLGRHLPGSLFVINHGDIGSLKFPGIMFPAPNPVEFYLLSALKSLEEIRSLERVIRGDFKRVNLLFVQEFQFCIFLVAALEAFLNQIIPNNFQYKNKGLTVDKSKVESKWSIEEKLKKAIPEIAGIAVAADAKKWATLTSVIKLRDDIIHLKTVYPFTSDFKSYQDLYRRLLDHDYEVSFNVVKDTIKVIGTAEVKKQEIQQPVLNWWERLVDSIKPKK